MSFFTPRARAEGTSSATLISFYDGTGTDGRGRSLAQMLQWAEDRLESSHDYIQMLFPLPEESGVNWTAPIIDRQVFEAFRSRPELRAKLRQAFSRMLWFYGFQLGHRSDSSVIVVTGPNFIQHSRNWDVPFDHNHLRITRIIRCLRVLGLEEEAAAFYAALLQAQRNVSPRSREFWQRAAKRDLNLRPDLEVEDEEDGDLDVGPRFLREWEAKRRGEDRGEQHRFTGHQEAQTGAPRAHVDAVQSDDTPEPNDAVVLQAETSGTRSEGDTEHAMGHIAGEPSKDAGTAIRGPQAETPLELVDRTEDTLLKE